MMRLWRILRYGPALYLAMRRIGGSRRGALSIAMWP